MLCVASLIVFSVLGLFSAAYRDKARQAFDCVMSTGTSGCESDVADEVKSSLVGKALTISPWFARFVNKYAVVFAWVFVLAFVTSTVFLGISVYNYVAYGHCDGPGEDGLCAYDAVRTSPEGSESTYTPVLPERRYPDKLHGL